MSSALNTDRPPSGWDFSSEHYTDDARKSKINFTGAVYIGRYIIILLSYCRAPINERINTLSTTRVHVHGHYGVHGTC